MLVQVIHERHASRNEFENRLHRNTCYYLGTYSHQKQKCTFAYLLTHESRKATVLRALPITGKEFEVYSQSKTYNIHLSNG